MKTRKETISFEKIKAQTKELHQLSFQLRMKLLSNLGVLHSSNTFNKSRQRAVENISSKKIVLNEVDFMRDAVSLYSNELLSFEERRDPLYSHVVLNEYRYLEFWVNNPDMKEIAINDEAVSFLAGQTLNNYDKTSSKSPVPYLWFSRPIHTFFSCLPIRPSVCIP